MGFWETIVNGSIRITTIAVIVTARYDSLKNFGVFIFFFLEFNNKIQNFYKSIKLHFFIIKKAVEIDSLIVY